MTALNDADTIANAWALPPGTMSHKEEADVHGLAMRMSRRLAPRLALRWRFVLSEPDFEDIVHNTYLHFRQVSDSSAPDDKPRGGLLMRYLGDAVRELWETRTEKGKLDIRSAVSDQDDEPTLPDHGECCLSLAAVELKLDLEQLHRLGLQSLAKLNSQPQAPAVSAFAEILLEVTTTTAHLSQNPAAVAAQLLRERLGLSDEEVQAAKAKALRRPGVRAMVQRFDALTGRL